MIRAFQWDLARQVERLDVLLRLLPFYAEWGYDELYLHLEDAVEYPSLPKVARKDAYSTRQMTELVKTATQVGIKVVPIVNLLGHTQYLIKTESLRDLNELRAEDGSPLERGQICPLHPGTIKVADKLLRDMAPFCTAGKVHVGLDESFHLGKCPRCRAEIAERGLAAHFAGHVDRMHTLVSSLGLRMGIWADMLNFVPEAIPLLPRDLIAYDWYYYPFKRHPRVELFNFAESDLATPLRGHGIEYWGCPMNGAFRYEPLPVFGDRLENLRSWWRRCKETEAGGLLVTSWEAYRLALEMTTVVDAAAASLWLDGGAPADNADWLERGFARVFGKSGAKTSARAALACDKYPFSGYARWEINDRWNGAVYNRDSGVKLFGKLANRELPKPLAASVAFRGYLAQREAFVARCVGAVSWLRRNAVRTAFVPRLRQLEAEAKSFSKVIAAGRNAARAMWELTRDRRARGQNEAIVDADAARLKAWTSWLRALRRDHTKAFVASPVFGAWQLIFTVHNFAPALQRVVVSQQESDGSWRELAARHTIEFQAEAAQSRTDFRRPFSAPIDSEKAVLRISIHGLGQVAIEGIVLTDGVTTLRPKGVKQRLILGKRAPRAGFPDIAAEPGEESILVLNF
ncbi:MAG: family 20 glycosylhydrolase [Nibricoccus sp.]